MTTTPSSTPIPAHPVATGELPPYPAIQAFLRHGRLAAVLAALAAAAFVSLLAWRLQWPAMHVASAAAALGVYFALRVAHEVVQLVADVLMPQ